MYMIIFCHWELFLNASNVLLSVLFQGQRYNFWRNPSVKRRSNNQPWTDAEDNFDALRAPHTLHLTATYQALQASAVHFFSPKNTVKIPQTAHTLILEDTCQIPPKKMPGVKIPLKFLILSKILPAQNTLSSKLQTLSRPSKHPPSQARSSNLPPFVLRSSWSCCVLYQTILDVYSRHRS